MLNKCLSHIKQQELGNTVSRNEGHLVQQVGVSFVGIYGTVSVQ